MLPKFTALVRTKVTIELSGQRRMKELTNSWLQNISGREKNG